MHFEAVQTTGIYCRAGCAGRPDPRNVEPFRSAVAAEAAGFRPCLRCRPERIAETPPEGAPLPVERALVLISEGFLDRHTEGQLAARVGYSTRQLRRLFQESVGASPAFVARSRRAHFARRLLDETDLSMDALSRAAGFSNRRQMNRVMKQTFRFAPGVLRRRRRERDVLMADGGVRLRVPCERPFEWQELLRYFAARAIPGVEQVEGRAYRRLAVTCGYPGLIEVRAGGGHLEVTAHLPTLNSLIDDVARVRRLFSLDDPPPPSVLSEDAVLGPLVRRLPHVRIPGAWDRFETAIRVIVGQQVSVAAASTVAGRIAARHGRAYELSPFGEFRSFPPAAVLAAGDLDGLGMPGGRVKSIHAFASAAADGSLDLYSGVSLEELTAELEALPGLGPWTSHMLALRVFRQPDAFPASDLGIRIAVGRLLGEERPSAKAVEQYAERWRPHRGLAAQYLWESLQEEER